MAGSRFLRYKGVRSKFGKRGRKKPGRGRTRKKGGGSEVSDKYGGIVHVKARRQCKRRDNQVGEKEWDMG